MVFQITKALPIPVIALGGIRTGEDAVEYFLAGATAVQVGTANFHDPKAPVNVLKQLRQFLQKRRIPSVRNLIGKLQT
jgi:dihydroorotate dehydrogenase (NAD+) catalytic subunit